MIEIRTLAQEIDAAPIQERLIATLSSFFGVDDVRPSRESNGLTVNLRSPIGDLPERLRVSEPRVLTCEGKLLTGGLDDRSMGRRPCRRRDRWAVRLVTALDRDSRV